MYSIFIKIIEERGEILQIIINNQSKVSIYEQIVLQIKSRILEGELKDGDVLPAMRTLAKELGVSVITTRKAYEQLQNEGFIISVVGKGTVVTVPKLASLKTQKYDEIQNQMNYVIKLAMANGYELNEVIEMFEKNCQKYNKIDNDKGD